MQAQSFCDNSNVVTLAGACVFLPACLFVFVCCSCVAWGGCFVQISWHQQQELHIFHGDCCGCGHGSGCISGCECGCCCGCGCGFGLAMAVAVAVSVALFVAVDVSAAFCIACMLQLC